MTERHISSDELSELSEGLLPPIRAAEVTEHLADCADCQGRQQAINDVQASLRDLEPITMPADVAEQLTGRLAAESGGPVASTDDATASSEPVTDEPPDAQQSAQTVVPLAARSRRRFSATTMASAAACFVIAAAIAAVAVGHWHHTDKTAGSSPTAGIAGPGTGGLSVQSAPPGATYTVHASGRTYTPSSVALDAPSLVTNSPLEEKAPVEGSAPGDSATSIPSPAASERQAGSPNGLAGGTSGGAEAGSSSASPVPASLRHLYRSRQALLTCAAAVTGTPGAVPLAVDFARWTNAQYHAAPSLVFVFRQTTTTGLVYVVGPTCQGLDQSRDFTTVQLP